MTSTTTPTKAIGSISTGLYSEIYNDINEKLIQRMNDVSGPYPERYTEETACWVTPRSVSIDCLPRTMIPACDCLLKRLSYWPALSTDCPGPWYDKVVDQINLPAADHTRSAEDFYAILFHELVHSTGYPTRLNRRTLYNSGWDSSTRYAFEEVSAELGSAYLCGMAGIADKTLEFSAHYIMDWLLEWIDPRREIARPDPALIRYAFQPAQKAVAYLLRPTVRKDFDTRFSFP